MQIRDSAKSGLFLIEMIIAILFFSISAAISTSLFVRAYMTSEHTRETNFAVIKAQSVAEGFKAMDGSAEKTAGLFAVNADNGGFSIYYDKNWNSAAPDKAAYRVDAVILSEASMKTIEISVVNLRADSNSSPLFTLEAKKYAP